MQFRFYERWLTTSDGWTRPFGGDCKKAVEEFCKAKGIPSNAEYYKGDHRCEYGPGRNTHFYSYTYGNIPDEYKEDFNDYMSKEIEKIAESSGFGVR